MCPDSRGSLATAAARTIGQLLQNARAEDILSLDEEVRLASEWGVPDRWRKIKPKESSSLFKRRITLSSAQNPRSTRCPHGSRLSQSLAPPTREITRMANSVPIITSDGLI